MAVKASSIQWTSMTLLLLAPMLLHQINVLEALVVVQNNAPFDLGVHDMNTNLACDPMTNGACPLPLAAGSTGPDLINIYLFTTAPTVTAPGVKELITGVYVNDGATITVSRTQGVKGKRLGITLDYV